MINQDLLLKALHEAGFQTVSEVSIEQGHDSTGELAYFIRLVMDASLSAAALRWSKLEGLESWVKNWVRNREETPYPYVRFVSKTEVEAVETS